MCPEQSCVVKFLDVYDPEMNVRGKAARAISEDDARRLIKNGEARKVNHGKAIVLFRFEADLDFLNDLKPLSEERRHGMSLRPSERVMTRAIDGSLAASVACSSWAGKVLTFPRSS